FFQAEDGIRDRTVTGVQTCALPILAYNGSGPPKLLEYNADTPTSVLEAAVIQWFWMKDVFPRMDQFNTIHERLIEAWKAAGAARSEERRVGKEWSGGWGAER